MSEIKLDSRLQAVASLVRKNSVVADIGTDHAYLLCYLIGKGICPGGIGADLRKGPLENARKTLIEYGLSDKVELILSDGLEKLPENCADDIVIAGMGGILISEILQKSKWIFNENINIVAQPMTHAEFLRKFLYNNGFEITREVTATDGKRLYCVISACYTGVICEKDRSCYYLGKLLENKDVTTVRYVEKMLSALEKKLSAREKANIEDTDNLGEVVSKIKLRISEAYYGQS